MVDRWARRKGDEKIRDLFLAIEFEVDLSVEPQDMWREGNLGVYSSKANFPYIFWDQDVLEEKGLHSLSTARIELRIDVENHQTHQFCSISESKFYLNGSIVAAICKDYPGILTKDQNDQVIKTKKKELKARKNSDLKTFVNYKERYFVVPYRPENIFLNTELVSAQYDMQSVEFGTHAFLTLVDTSYSPYQIYPAGFGEDFDKTLQYATDIFFYFGASFCKLIRNLPGVVKGDRRAPSPHEAIFLVDLNLGGWWLDGSLSTSIQALMLESSKQNIDEHLKGLAELTHADLLLRATKNENWGGSHAAKYIEEVRNLSNQLASINAHLERSLFKEKLYKLTCESIALVPLDLTEDDPRGYYILAQPAAVKLLLSDQNGLKLQLQDVGSGIPFVLPVLYAATSGGFAMIQQPELHLHPALQSSIADIFIEEVNQNSNSQFLIETHSEHLLLRILRRIRETEKKKALSSSLEISHDRVAVYYFDPQITGETIITSLPITPLGDFYTDWPRGFFEERNNDLFDED